MLKKIISSLLAFWTVAASGQPALHKKSIERSKNVENNESRAFPKEKVDEYFFKVINYANIGLKTEVTRIS